MSPLAQHYEFELEQHLAASPEAAFDALLDPKAQQEWWGAAGDVVRARADLRVDGTARVEWGPSETALIRADQVFRELDRPRRVVYAETVTQTGSPVYECLLTLALEPAPGGTRLSLHHQGFPSREERDLHEHGTRIFLARLARYLARRTG